MANKELVDAVKKSGAQALADYRAKKPREHIDLAGAIFPEGSFAGAKLVDIDFSGAYLREADLKGADLRLSVLNGTNLEGADLSGAVLGRTTLANLDLTKTKGLDKVVFEAPCEIGLSTLLTIENPAARRVLARGTGYTDAVIDQLCLLNEKPKSLRACFLAYVRRDGAFARWMTQKFEAEGWRVWQHVIDQPGKLSAFRDILANIRPEDWVVLLASEASMTNEIVDKSIEKILQARKLQPIALDRYLSTDWEHYLRNDMMQLRIVPFYECDTDAKRDEAAAKVVAAIRRGLMEHL